MKKNFYVPILTVCFISCNSKHVTSSQKGSEVGTPIINHISLQQNKIKIDGLNLRAIATVDVNKQNMQFEEIDNSLYVIISKSVQLVALKSLDLLITDAYGQTQNYNLYLDIKDGSISAKKLANMNAEGGDVLMFDSKVSQWQPKKLTGLLNYQGVWNGKNLPSEDPIAGEYWVVS